MRIVFALAAFALMVVLFGRAWDHELESTAPAQASTVTLTETYQGKSVIWWANRAVQARRDANARGRTIRRLQRAQARESAHFFDWMQAAACVISKEGTWTTNTGNGYYGALQADLSFQRAYGWEHYRRWGTANQWPWWAQLEMGYRGWLFRGWGPWPNTARACGLR
jgi:hypothetical protein